MLVMVMELFSRSRLASFYLIVNHVFMRWKLFRWGREGQRGRCQITFAPNMITEYVKNVICPLTSRETNEWSLERSKELISIRVA